MVLLELRLADSSLACRPGPPGFSLSDLSDTGLRLLTREKSVPGIVVTMTTMINQDKTKFNNKLVAGRGEL